MKKILLLLGIAATGFLHAGWGQTQKHVPVGEQMISFAKKASKATPVIASSNLLTIGLGLSGLSTIYYGQSFLFEQKKMKKIGAELDSQLEKAKSAYDDAAEKLDMALPERRFHYNPKQTHCQVDQTVVESYKVARKNYKKAQWHVEWFNDDTSNQFGHYYKQWQPYNEARNKFCLSLLSTATFAGLWWWKNYYSK